MTVLLDAAVVIIFVITCITGYVMGFFKYAALMLKSVAALIVAVCAALMLAAPAYNAFARDKAVSRIESKIEKFDIVSIMESDLRKRGLKPVAAVIAAGQNVRVVIQRKINHLCCRVRSGWNIRTGSRTCRRTCSGRNT